MITKIRVLLEYNTYCLWLHDENDEVIDNDTTLTDAFMAVSNLYDTFFVDDGKEFSYKGGCPDEATATKLRELFSKAMELLMARNNGKYYIQNDVSLDFL